MVVRQRIGVVGATGAVGRVTLALLAERAPPEDTGHDPFLAECLETQAGRKRRLDEAGQLQRAGKADQALAMLQKVAADSPGEDSYLALGAVLAQAGELERAEEAAKANLPPDSQAPFEMPNPLPPVVLGVPARDDADEVVALMLSHLLRRKSIPAAATPRPSHNLPLRFTRFFGREREIAALVELLGGDAQSPAGAGTRGTEARRGTGGEGAGIGLSTPALPEPAPSLPPSVSPPGAGPSRCPLRGQDAAPPLRVCPSRLVTMTGPGGTGPEGGRPEQLGLC